MYAYRHNHNIHNHKQHIFAQTIHSAGAFMVVYIHKVPKYVTHYIRGAPFTIIYYRPTYSAESSKYNTGPILDRTNLRPHKT